MADPGPRVSIDIESPIMLKWRSIARRQKRLHNRSAETYGRMYRIALVATVALAFVSGTVSLMEVMVGEAVSPRLHAVASGCLSLLSGAVITASSSLSWQQLHDKHHEYALRYNELVREINAEFSVLATGPAGMDTLVRRVQAELNSIEESAPVIPTWAERELGETSALNNGD